jgi:hypothetical protein
MRELTPEEEACWVADFDSWFEENATPKMLDILTEEGIAALWITAIVFKLVVGDYKNLPVLQCAQYTKEFVERTKQLESQVSALESENARLREALEGTK